MGITVQHGPIGDDSVFYGALMTMTVVIEIHYECAPETALLLTDDLVRLS
jgi:hypothetical protein